MISELAKDKSFKTEKNVSEDPIDIEEAVA